MLFPRQVLVLVYKNILIAFFRRPITTTLRALVLPIIIGWFFSYAQNFFATPATYGIGSPHDVRSFQDALALTGSRDQLVFVNNGFQGGQIEQIINQVGSIAQNAGKRVRTIESEQELLTVCRNTLRGASDCIAGVVFHSSPTEPAGTGQPYSYTLRFDGIFGSTIDVDVDTNAEEVFLLPLQKEIDKAIATVNGSLPVNAVNTLQEFPYTSISQEQRNTDTRLRYMRALINFLGVGFFIGMCGIQYQQVGAQATEREGKMSQLLEVMMPNRRRWVPQVARLLSYHISFTLIYLPGWIIMAIILKIYVFVRTPVGIVIGLHILTGLSLASFSLFAAAFFKKAQLSGITTILVSLVLAIIAQVTPLTKIAVYVLSAIFPSANYVFQIIYMARFERRNHGTVLTEMPSSVGPNTGKAANVRGMILWILLGAQIVIYPLLGLMVERALWGTASGKRHLAKHSNGAAVELRDFSKHFRPNWFVRMFLWMLPEKRRETVRAVDDLSFHVHRGQIVVLLGANGSGKSTTLDAIAGLSKPTKGSVTVNFENGLGFCPQQNVLWKDLTVYEHVKIFDHLKSIGKRATKQNRLGLIRDCDLDHKVTAKAGSLSGGQMRKLQLASMFIGDSGICLVDECSSGIDPLARKKVQDILLAERSRSQRTIIFTSHYLDEADIADYILIMSKGKLKVQGTAPEIKHSGQYRIHIYHSPGQPQPPHFENVSRREMYDQTVYTVDDAASTARLLKEVEAQGFSDYSVNGPTVEDAFMAVAEEMVPSNDKVVEVNTTVDPSNKGTSNDVVSESSQLSEKDLNLHAGTHIGPFRQATVLFWKRCQVFVRSVYPNLAALIIVPVAAYLTSRFLQGFQRAGCITSEADVISDASISLVNAFAYGPQNMVLGPQSAWTQQAVQLIIDSLPSNITALVGPQANLDSQISNFFSKVQFVSTSTQLYQYISANSQRIIPGGIFLGSDTESPMIGYVTEGYGYIAFPILLQNIVSIVRYGNPIAVQYQPFDIPWQAGQGNTLQYTIYFALVLSVTPAFFSLYPTLERIRHVRGLHYSNGVRALPLWLSYTLFDLSFVVVAATISIAILAARFSDIMFGLGYFWFVMVLFGLCATLCGYVVSLFARSQLAAFAISAAYQAACCLLWLITYLSLVTYGDPNRIDQNLNDAHFTLALIMPAASMFKALFVSLNVLSINCRGAQSYVSSPGAITAYGGPILYLIIQSLLLFVLLVWWDSGNKFGNLFRSKHRVRDQEEKKAMEPEVLEELERVTNAGDDGLRVMHLSKAYGKNLAVDDTSFGVKRGEVFGLLGPNGAGKSTTISAIRGDIKPNAGEIYIENLSLKKKRTQARQHLSACPQHDAMDRLTVTEHLKFYARIRGVKNVKHNVATVIQAVGLSKFEHRMAEKLSGGNKRKLSLGIALMGNPTVMLLDEPSSGMDVAAKRVMWRTLEAVVGGRSIVLTTHSMEEADRLCTRAGILAKHLLTVGTIDELKKKHGGRYYVHILLKSAPYTDASEEERVKDWIGQMFSGAEIDARSHHGQIRFSVPVQPQLQPQSQPQMYDNKSIVLTQTTPISTSPTEPHTHTDTIKSTPPPPSQQQPSLPQPTSSSTNPNDSTISTLFSTLETNKSALNFEYYSVGHATLDQVFLRIVTKHDVEEENSRRRGNEMEGGKWMERGVVGWVRRLF